MEELVESVRQHGILQPLVVEMGGERRYKLQIGKGRLAADKLAWLEKVPVTLLDGPLDF